MPNVQSVSFTNPYSQEEADIERARKMAEMLQAQGSAPMDINRNTGMFNARISPLEGIGKIAQSFAGAFTSQKAEDKQKELTEKYQQDYRDMVAKGLNQLQGTPAQPGGDYEDSMGIGRSNPGQAAVAPNPTGALATFGGHPMGAQFAPMAMQQIQRQQMIQALSGGQGGQPGAPAAPGAPQQGGAPAAGMQAPPGVPPQAMGGPAGGQPLQVWLQVDPSGKAYIEQLAKDYAAGQKPMAVAEGGSVWQPGKGFVATRPKLGEGVLPITNAQGDITGVKPMPGDAEAQAARTGAIEGAKAGFDMVTVQTPQGPKMMTRAQAAQMAGGGQQTPPGPQVPDYKTALEGFRNGGTGSVEIAGKPPLLPVGPLPQELRAPASGPGIPLQDQASQKAETEIGQGLGKRYNEIQDAGFGANQKLNKVSRLGTLLDNVTTGKLSPAGYELAGYAQSFGFPVSKNLPNAQAVKAIANELALELRNPAGGAGMPGAMSDADRNYLQGLIANLDKTPEANKMMVEGMKKLAERERDIAKLAREYKRKTGTFNDGFYDELDKFSRENPLFGGQQGSPDDPLGLRKNP